MITCVRYKGDKIMKMNKLSVEFISGNPVKQILKVKPRISEFYIGNYVILMRTTSPCLVTNLVYSRLYLHDTSYIICRAKTVHTGLFERSE